MQPLFLVTACVVGLFLDSSVATAEPPAIAQASDRELQSLIRDLEREIERLAESKKSWLLELRCEPIEALRKMGPRAEPAIPMLIRAMKEGKSTLPMNAGVALGDLGKVAVPDLTELLDHPRNETRWQALHSLERIGLDAKAAIPRLIQMLQSKDPTDREKAMETLAAIGSGTDKQLVSVFVKLTESDDEDIRGQAVLALATLSPSPKEAEPIMLRILANPKSPKSLRFAAVRGLGILSTVSEKVVPVLAKELATDDPLILSYAARSIWLIGATKDTIPALAKLVKHPPKPPEELTGEELYVWEFLHRAARGNAITALDGVKEEAPDKVLPLLKYVAENDPDKEVRSCAAFLLASDDDSEE